MYKLIITLIVLGIMATNSKTYSQESSSENKNKSKKIGIALSGGGALGYAHIGFLQAMEEYKISPEVISGTSMGSIIGVLYSAGYKPIEIFDLVDKENMNSLFNVIKLNKSFGKGFFNHDKLRKLLEKSISHNSFDSLKTRFYCCVTDFNTASYRHISKGGYLREYISASASIPIIYEPVEVEGEQYVDGGLMQNLPVEPLIEEGCDLIIGVDVVSATKRIEVSGLSNILDRTITLTIMQNTSFWAEKCNYIVKPNLQDYTIMDFDKANELFEIGYQAGLIFFKNYKRYF